METVKSDDGTVIAYDRTGDGPALVVTVGAFCTRHTFVAPDELKQRFTVVTYDRRGRGDSGDTEPFAPEKEYADLAVVAAATGPEPPFVYGHSSGAARSSSARSGPDIPEITRTERTRGYARTAWASNCGSSVGHEAPMREDMTPSGTHSHGSGRPERRLGSRRHRT